jgi:hypothetical protein
MSVALWRVQGTADPRFPFRISITQGPRTLFAFRAKAAWPGAGSQVFCLREREPPVDETFTEIEQVPVAHLARLGRKLSVTLDRAQRKRCEFLILEKPLSDGSGSYEQVFFRTEAATRAHRNAKTAELSPNSGYEVVIDSTERYPWRFPGATELRRKLPVGDYALLFEERIAAVVERKTRENLLSDFGELKGLHQQLAELSSYPHAALVIEAQYADFGDAAKAGRWPVAHLLRVLAELPVLFPSVQLIFAGNRKLANLWTQRFFAAAEAALRQPRLPQVAEASAQYRKSPAEGGLDTRIRIAALKDLPDRFPIALLLQQFPETKPERVRRVLDGLRSEGKLRVEGRGRGARWCRA